MRPIKRGRKNDGPSRALALSMAASFMLEYLYDRLFALGASIDTAVKNNDQKGTDL